MFIEMCVFVSPVLCVCSAAAETLLLWSSSLMPVLLASKQMTSCMDDLTPRCVETDANEGAANCRATSADGEVKESYETSR